PIVTFMDTPGADAGEEANANNQAHSISRLITAMSNVHVPNVGIIFGVGYSGGAIPLAASNLILSLRDGVFSTIQPAGLASIARRLNLSWQECAKYVGVSAPELHAQGNIDAIVDYSPTDSPEKIENLRSAIVGSLVNIESQTAEFVAENPYILDHYRQSLLRYLKDDGSAAPQQVSAPGAFSGSKNPTEYLNVFGIAFRYLRYLRVRKRIKATSTKQYGRLAPQEIPSGELHIRADRERRQTFLYWLQDPAKVVYDDGLAKAWRNYLDKRQAVNDERGRIAQMIFGEPKQNFETARNTVISTFGAFLYNRWKREAAGNLTALREYLHSVTDTRQILQVDSVDSPRGLLTAIRSNDELLALLRQNFSYEGRKLLSADGASESYVAKQLMAELNLVITGPRLAGAQGATDIQANRAFLAAALPEFIPALVQRTMPVAIADMNVLDVLLYDDLRLDFIRECENLLLFDGVYDQALSRLESVAQEAQASQSLSEQSLGEFLQASLQAAVPEDGHAERQIRIFEWYGRVAKMPKSEEFFQTVEEWKKLSFTHLSDALFVVVTYLFTTLLQSYLAAQAEGKPYQGKIAPRNIGRRKDF
ncbi:MAG: carbamoyl-phosphate synthase large subunit, partial [Proteobacteria bacterium]|nr:carbamoyl-phosphate synthase large subunit [Pseudomonadota bacterium]